LVGDEALVDGVRDSPFQCPERFLFGFAFFEFAVVVAASRGVEADLGDGGHVDGMVESTVAAQREPVPGLPAEDTSMGAVPL
jgi:hypothetical protein